MIKFQSVCKDCAIRTVGCHSTCKKYLEAKENHRKEQEIFMKQAKAEDDIDDFKVTSVIATKNKYKRR